MSVSAGQPHERVKPRDHADVNELRQPDGRAQVVLRAHQAESSIATVLGQRRQDGNEKLHRNGRRRVRL